ncbi:MAG TPA: CRISPR-associated protein Cas4 [Methanocorpusculum sp.]|nr:CRISPR-associated protein Cas4 [Methanocorpusculum sp.]
MGREMITISDILEHIFCPRFTYYMHVLEIQQHEDRRFKVMKGREVHEKRAKENTGYLRKKLGVCRREEEVFLVSKELQIKGVVDVVLWLSDGTMAPFEYKYSEYAKVIPETYLVQLAFQGALLQENYGLPVAKGYVCFVRSNNRVEEVVFPEDMYQKLELLVGEIATIMQEGYYPERVQYSNRCRDCTYRNLCQ